LSLQKLLSGGYRYGATPTTVLLSSVRRPTSTAVATGQGLAYPLGACGNDSQTLGIVYGQAPTGGAATPGLF